MNINDLTPAPWTMWGGHETFAIYGDGDFPRSAGRRVVSCDIDDVGGVLRYYDAEFIALARNDLDVQLRRGWHVEKCTDADQWLVPQMIENMLGMADGKEFDDLLAAAYQEHHPVGLLTKADKWMKENVEAQDGDSQSKQ